MTEPQRVMLIHAGCVAMIVGCFVIAGTVLKGQPLLAGGVVAVGAWLWGKLGFRPATVILERVVARHLGLSLDEIKQITIRPPPAAADEGPNR